ncbi:hypothetical protein V8E53_004724 [Lactarius tabidus]
MALPPIQSANATTMTMTETAKGLPLVTICVRSFLSDYFCQTLLCCLYAWENNPKQPNPGLRFKGGVKRSWLSRRPRHAMKLAKGARRCRGRGERNGEVDAKRVNTKWINQWQLRVKRPPSYEAKGRAKGKLFPNKEAEAAIRLECRKAAEAWESEAEARESAAEAREGNTKSARQCRKASQGCENAN